MLHASLIELAEQAPLCTDQATLRGVLTESHDLTRNALAHDTNAVEVAHWFSRLLTDALHSPAATELTDGRIQIVTGPFGRGEGMPTSPVEWLSILPKSVPYQYNQNLEKVLTETGFVLAPLPATLLPTTREDWEHRINHALEHGDGEALGVYTDAGTPHAWPHRRCFAMRWSTGPRRCKLRLGSLARTCPLIFAVIFLAHWLDWPAGQRSRRDPRQRKRWTGSRRACTGASSRSRRRITCRQRGGQALPYA